MICPKCGQEYSDSVIRYHMERCQVAEQEGKKPLEKMTVPELEAYAKEKEIDLGEAKKKADILSLITAFEKGEDDGGRSE